VIEIRQVHEMSDFPDEIIEATKASAEALATVPGLTVRG
jgi:hypothetical protein